MHARTANETQGEIPVFVYHSIDPEEFEAHLLYLSENGYQTIDCDTYLEILKGRRPAPARAVMLTIDDGRASVYSTAFPLLQAYNMQAVVFLIPGYIRDRGSAQAVAADRQDLDLMTWSDIAEIARAGCVDFQSHTHFHHRVPVSDKLLGFVTPDTATALFDVPVAPGHEPNPTASKTALLGYPIFEAASRMSGKPAFLPNESFVQNLLTTVRMAGPAFFQDSEWPQKLEAVVEKWRQKLPALGRFETSAETEAAIENSLRVSKAEIESRIPQASVRHLCFPYTIGSQLAVDIAKRTGYESCFWGLRQGQRCNRSGDDPMFSVRLKGDFLMRLPGTRRMSRSQIFLSKVKRRLSGAPVY